MSSSHIHKFNFKYLNFLGIKCHNFRKIFYARKASKPQDFEIKYPKRLQLLREK